MKIIFDCTTLTNWEGKPTGIQRVIRELGLSLSNVMPENITAVFDELGKCYTYCLESKTIGDMLSLDSGDMIFASGHDWDYLAHFSHLCKYSEKGINIAFLFYDIIPLKFPFTYKKEFVERFEYWLRSALGLAKMCFTISCSTRNDLLDYANKLNLNIPEINVLRIGDNLPQSNHTITDMMARRIKEPYIFSVGTIEYRKNHIILLNTYRYMIGTLGVEVPKLYIAGRQGLYDANVRIQVEGDPVLSNKVEILSGLDDSDLVTLYKSAMFTVYPSIYEGWGLPVAESLNYGVPCITSRSSSMVEIAPELTPFADPLMTNEWVDKIGRWISHPEELLQAKINVKNNYKKTSWNDSACYLRDCLTAFLHNCGE